MGWESYEGTLEGSVRHGIEVLSRRGYGLEVVEVVTGITLACLNVTRRRCGSRLKDVVDAFRLVYQDFRFRELEEGKSFALVSFFVRVVEGQADDGISGSCFLEFIEVLLSLLFNCYSQNAANDFEMWASLLPRVANVYSCSAIADSQSFCVDRIRECLKRAADDGERRFYSLLVQLLTDLIDCSCSTIDFRIVLLDLLHMVNKSPEDTDENFRISQFLAKLGSRFPENFSRIYENVDTIDFSFDTVTTLFSAFEACDIAQQVLLKNLTDYSTARGQKFWYSIRTHIESYHGKSFDIGSIANTTKAALSLHSCEDRRWDNFFAVLDALSHEDVHHFKNAWPTMNLIMTKFSDINKNLPTLDISWASICFDKALKHPNGSVRRAAALMLSNDLIRWSKNAQYMKIPKEIFFSVILPGMNQPDLHRVVVQDDATFCTGKLYPSSDRYDSLFLCMVEEEARKGVVHESDFLRTYVSIFCSLGSESNPYFVHTIVRGLAEFTPSSDSWVGDLEVANMERLAKRLHPNTEGHQKSCLSRLILNLLLVIVCNHGSPDNILNVVGLLRFFDCCKARELGQIHLISGWIHQSPILIKKVSSTLIAAFRSDAASHQTLFGQSCTRIAFDILASDLSALQSFAPSFADAMVGTYDNKDVAITECPISYSIAQLLEYCRDSESSRVALETLLSTSLLTFLDWCSQKVQNFIKGKRRSSSGCTSELIEPSLALHCQPIFEENQYVWDSDFKNLDCALSVYMFVCKYAVLEDNSISRDLTDRIRRSGLSVIDNVVHGETLVEKGTWIGPVRLFVSDPSCVSCLDDRVWNNLLQVFSNLLSEEFATDQSRSGFTYSTAFARHCWECVLGLLSYSRNYQLKPETRQALLLSAVGELYHCDDRILSPIFAVVRNVLSYSVSEGNVVDEIDWMEVSQACIYALRNQDKQVPKIYYDAVVCLFQPCIFYNEVVECNARQPIIVVLRQTWAELLKLSPFCAAYALGSCSKNLAATYPQFAIDFTGELFALCHLTFAMNTLDTANMEKYEIYSSWKGIRFDVSGVVVHPWTYAHFCVLYSLHESPVSNYWIFVDHALSWIENRSKQRGNKALLGDELMEEISAWRWVTLCCSGIGGATEESLPETKQWDILNRLLNKHFISSSNRHTRFRIELCVSFLLLSSRGTNAVDYLCNDFIPKVCNRTPLKASLAIVLGIVVNSILKGDCDAYWTCNVKRLIIHNCAASALILAGDSDVVVRTLSTYVSEVAYSCLVELNPKENSEDPLDSMYKHILGVLVAREIRSSFDDIFKCFNLREHCRIHFLVRQPLNAYGQPILSILADEVEKCMNKFLLEKHNVVRSITAKKAAVAKSKRSAAELENNSILVDDSHTCNDGEVGIATPMLQRKVNPRTRRDGPGKSDSWRCERFRTKLIVVASVLDDVRGVAALVRTSEIFAADELTVNDLSIIDEDIWKALSMSASGWLNLRQVPATTVPEFLRSKKNEGYCILALEQHEKTNEESLVAYLHDFQFPKNGKVVLVCGNPVSGIPVPVLRECGRVLSMVRYGTSRELLPHIYAGLAVWEYTRQQVLNVSQ